MRTWVNKGQPPELSDRGCDCDIGIHCANPCHCGWSENLVAGLNHYPAFGFLPNDSLLFYESAAPVPTKPIHRRERLRDAIRLQILGYIQESYPSTCSHLDADIEWGSRGNFQYRCLECGIGGVGRADDRNPEMD